MQINQFDIYMLKKRKIQEEGQHIEQQFVEMAEEQQEVELVMEEEMVKRQLGEQSKCHSKKSV